MKNVKKLKNGIKNELVIIKKRKNEMKNVKKRTSKFSSLFLR